MRQIKISVNPVGAATVDAIGFQGQGCAAATEAIEKALAGGSGKVTKDFKEEWQAQEQTTQEHNQQW